MRVTPAIKNYILLLLILIAVLSCSKKDSTPPGPEKVQLTFPVQNALCTSGTVLSATQASVTLTWGAANYADSYEIHIRNLLTSAVITQNTASNRFTTVLSRNTPYLWYVISLSSAVPKTMQSDTWRFYMAGEGAQTYAPFPANLTAPAFGASVAAGAVNLTWAGSDVDGDITGYDVYFGTTANPALLKAGVNDMFLNNLTVTSGKTYYWRVITKDGHGNTSDSGIFQFEII